MKGGIDLLAEHLSALVEAAGKAVGVEGLLEHLLERLVDVHLLGGRGRGRRGGSGGAGHGRRERRDKLRTVRNGT